MSDSRRAAVHVRSTDDASADLELVDGDGVPRALLAALDDARCREIIGATDGESLSATEISDTCEIPLSTTYRKLETLTDAGLLAERTRLNAGGSHPSEFRSVVDEVVLTVGSGAGPELHVVRGASSEGDSDGTGSVSR